MLLSACILDIHSRDMIPHSRVNLSEQLVDSVGDILRNGELCDAEITRDFEKSFASHVGRTFARATSSGTRALHLALMALGVGRSQSVLIPSYVCDDLLSAVIEVGAIPVPVDCEPDSYNLCARDLERRITADSSVIIVSHMFGVPVDFDAITKFDLPVIEDFTHALGATYRERIVGSLGDISVCSFHALKLLAIGEGGILLADRPDILQRVSCFSNPDFSRGEYRLDYHLSNIHAAIGMIQLKEFRDNLAGRNKLYDRYTSALCNLDNLQLPEERESDCVHTHYRYCIRSEKKFTDVEMFYRKSGVIVRRPVKTLNHRLLGLSDSEYPNATRIFERTVSIPFYPGLCEEEIDKVLSVSRNCFLE